MPVVSRQLVVLLMAAMLLPSAALSKEDSHKARTRSVIKKAEQLEDVKAVRSQRQPYKLVVAASYIHQECAAELGITEVQRRFVADRFTKASEDYVTALDQAFVNRMKTPSTAAVKQDYIRYLQDLQKPVINNTASIVKYKGCKDKALAQVLEYFDALQKAEEDAKQAKINANPPPVMPDVLNADTPTAKQPEEIEDNPDLGVTVAPVAGKQ